MLFWFVFTRSRESRSKGLIKGQAHIVQRHEGVQIKVSELIVHEGISALGVPGTRIGIVVLAFKHTLPVEIATSLLLYVLRGHQEQDNELFWR